MALCKLPVHVRLTNLDASRLGPDALAVSAGWRLFGYFFLSL